MGESMPVPRIDEEVDLMNVERVNLLCVIHHAPMAIGPDSYSRHGRIGRTVFSTIDVKDFSIVRDVHNEVRRTIVNFLHHGRR
jgi:hypothetical protein